MSYRLKIENNEGTLLVKATGARTYENVLNMTLEIMEACIQHGTPKVLVDVRDLEGRLNVLDSFTIPDEVFPRIRDRRVIQKSAIVDVEEFQGAYRFFENVAVNRGFNLRIFSDQEEAMLWLRK